MDRVSIKHLGRNIWRQSRSIAAIGMIFLVTSECHAGPLLDWLFGRNRTTAYYPVNPPGSGVANPAAGGCCGPGVCEQTVLRYVPQVAYRTVWQPVPVTTYKRTVSYHPTTGLPRTCTQPCTTYTYQARRVPYTTYRPTYATVPVSIPGNCSTGVAQASYAAQDNCGCNSGVPATGLASNGSSPYYSVPSSTPGATDWQRIEPNLATPSGDPRADDRPRIPPRIQPDLEGASIQRIPSTSQQYSDNSSRFTARPTWSSQQYSYTNSDRFYRSPTDWQRVGSNESFSSTNSGRSAVSSTPKQPSLDPPANVGGLQPIPNLTPPRNQAPRRFDLPRNPGVLNERSRDNTASLIRTIPTRWVANRIVWPASYRETVEPAETPRVQIDRGPSVSPRRLDPRLLRGEQTTSEWKDSFRSRTTRQLNSQPRHSPSLLESYPESGWKTGR